MFISRELKKKNIGEYLLYMWQVEDLIRAYDCNVDRMRDEYVPRFTQYTEAQQKELIQWYSDLVDMMRRENIIVLLTDLHNEVLKSPKHPLYSAAYYKALPFIVEVRNKSGKTDAPELENCFDVLYGTMLLRLQKKPISAETQGALKEITHLISMLSGYYQQEKEGKLEL